MKFKFWGVRGSVATGGNETAKVGGNTTCLEVRCGNDLLIFDSGTGIRYLGNTLMKELPLRARLFYTHVHWDHIQGLPFFTPLYIPGNEFEIYGGSALPLTIEEALKTQMKAPWFPVKMDIMGASRKFFDLKPGDVVLGKDYQVTLVNQYHPNNSYAYRIDYNGCSIVFATDTEHHEDRIDEDLLRLSQDADYLIYDCQFTTDEYYGRNGQMPRIGWGHSTLEEGIKLAQAAEVKKFVLFHHDPSHNDEFIWNLEVEARKIFPNCVVAYEGLDIDVNDQGIPRSVFD